MTQITITSYELNDGSRFMAARDVGRFYEAVARRLYPDAQIDVSSINRLAVGPIVSAEDEGVAHHIDSVAKRELPNSDSWVEVAR